MCMHVIHGETLLDNNLHGEKFSVNATLTLIQQRFLILIQQPKFLILSEFGWAAPKKKINFRMSTALN